MNNFENNFSSVNYLALIYLIHNHVTQRRRVV